LIPEGIFYSREVGMARICLLRSLDFSRKPACRQGRGDAKVRYAQDNGTRITRKARIVADVFENEKSILNFMILKAGWRTPCLFYFCTRLKMAFVCQFVPSWAKADYLIVSAG